MNDISAQKIDILCLSHKKQENKCDNYMPKKAKTPGV